MENKTNKEFTLNMRQYKRYFNDFVNYKEDFSVVHDGSSIIINCRDKSWRFIDYGGITGRGFHLSKFVYKDAKEYILKNPEVLKVNDNIDLEIQKANSEGLKKYEGQQIYCVDVNDCYWDTAYNMGFISQETYLRGLQKKEWKTGRNASIGGLSKVVVVSDFKGGIRTTSYQKESEIDLSIIRDAIVKKVHNMFLEVLKQLKNDWLMYFTDCVYIPFDKIKEVEAYFEKQGYQTKVSTYQLDIVNLDTNMIYWHDYQKNKAKSFKFGERQFSLLPIPKYKETIELVSKIENNTNFLNEK